MIPDLENSSNEVLGSSLSLPAHGRAGARATPFLAAHFAKRNTKFGGGGTPVVERFAFTTGQEARADKNSSPPNPFPFCPPERKLSKVSVRIFFEKSSDFVQDRQPICKVCVFPLARGGVYPAYSLLLCGAPRFGGQIFKQFPNEPILFRPKGESKAAIFCPKAITN